MGPKQVLPLWVKVDLGEIAMKRYFTLLRAPNLEPHHHMQFNVIPRTSPYVLPFCKRFSQRILRPANREGFWMIEYKLCYMSRYTVSFTFKIDRVSHLKYQDGFFFFLQKFIYLH